MLVLAYVGFCVGLVVVLSTAFYLGRITKKVDGKIIYKDSIVQALPLSCDTEKKIIFRDKIIYKEITKVRYIDKAVFRNNFNKIKYGISLVGVSTHSKIIYGLGFKIQYGPYYGQTAILEDKSIMLSGGYEF